MFKVKTENELNRLLKLISEEAVRHTKKTLKEDDQYDDRYNAMRKKEKSMFEQPVPEEEAPAPPKPPAPKPPEEAEPDVTTSKDDEKEPEAADQKPSEENFSGSKDRLVDFVNDIRSAPSLKDSAVDAQVSAYYDRLSEEERDVLVFFLRELSKVMTGKTTGDAARDPSDPPLSIDFVSKNQETTEEEPAPAPPQADSTPKPPAKMDSSEEEDTAPPIKVNESQNHAHLRRKIRSLF